MYSWQHCGTGTLSYRQPRHLVIMDQWNGQQRAFAIKMFYNFVFFKSSRFFVSPCISIAFQYLNLQFLVLVDGTCLTGCKFEGGHSVVHLQIFIDLTVP